MYTRPDEISRGIWVQIWLRVSTMKRLSLAEAGDEGGLAHFSWSERGEWRCEDPRQQSAESPTQHWGLAKGLRSGARDTHRHRVRVTV